VVANPATNAVHLVAFVVASFLLPIGAVGLAYFAYLRPPWLAVRGGLFGVALRRARILPRWAAWAMITRGPLTVAAFAFHGGGRVAVGVAALTLLLIGSLPAARTMLTRPRVSD
jgi:hypothetical protein